MTLDGMKYIARMSGCLVFDYTNSEIMRIVLGIYDNSLNASAMLFMDEHGNKYIFVDDTMPEEKQMFAIAHELGHWILKHEHGLPFDIEKEADEFAKTMLLTTRALNKGVVL